MSSLHALQGRDLHFSFRGRHVLMGVDIAVDEGEVVSLLGANGAGKSTLLRLMLGLLRPSRGGVLLDGLPLARMPRRQIARCLAYVPQVHVAPFPYTVHQVVMMGRLGQIGLFQMPSRGDSLAVDDCLERLGIAALAGRRYTEISGGERQLALIARALAQGARILVLDEPAASLDFGHQIRLLRRLRMLAADGYAVVMTTHHPDHAVAVSNRVVLLHDGRIVDDGPPDQVVTAAAIFRLYGVGIGSMNDIAGGLVQAVGGLGGAKIAPTAMPL